MKYQQFWSVLAGTLLASSVLSNIEASAQSHEEYCSWENIRAGRSNAAFCDGRSVGPRDIPNNDEADRGTSSSSQGYSGSPSNGGTVKTRHGSLSSSDSRLNNGRPYDTFSFQGRRGDTISIDMRSSDFDSYIVLKDPDGDVIERDDDGGSGSNARIQVSLPVTGTYQILASCYGSGRGDYSVRVANESEAGSSTSSTSSSSGSSSSSSSSNSSRRLLATSGALRSSDDRLDDGSYFDAYTFRVNSGDVIKIDMESDDFDTYLILKGPNGETIEEDDDGGRESNSRIRARLSRSGTYTLWANSYERDTGRYSIRVLKD